VQDNELPTDPTPPPASTDPITEDDIVEVQVALINQACKLHFVERKDGSLNIGIETFGKSIVLVHEDTFLRMGKAYAAYKHKKKAKRRLILPGEGG
jgi:hypothetical protein